jgi:hypothetical protein
LGGSFIILSICRGEYLKERFQAAHQKAQALGLKVEFFSRSEVIDLEERCDKIHLTVKRLLSGSIFSCVADRVLRAAVHWLGKRITTFHHLACETFAPKDPGGPKDRRHWNPFKCPRGCFDTDFKWPFYA